MASNPLPRPKRNAKPNTKAKPDDASAPTPATGSADLAVPGETDPEEGPIVSVDDVVAELQAEAPELAGATTTRGKRRSWLPASRADPEVDPMFAAVSPEQRLRLWELTLEAQAYKYVGVKSKISCFFVVSLGPQVPRLKRNRVKLLPEFTSACHLDTMVTKKLSQGTILYNKKTFTLSYKNLEDHILQIDMWEISLMSFNNYCGIGWKPLSAIARRQADQQIKIRLLDKALTTMELEAKLKKPPAFDVAIFDCIVNLEEVFDLRLIFENWNLETSKKPKQRKSLTFIIPKDYRSAPYKKKRCHSCTVPWMSDQSIQKEEDRDEPDAVKTKRFFWPTVGKFIFRGTRTSLQNSYCLVNVHSGNPLHESTPTFGVIGTSLLNFISVLDLAIFQGKVKCVSNDSDKFSVGQITGNINCIMCSVGGIEDENIPGGRPFQPKTAATVSHLNPDEIYLVVFIKKCDFLPAADPEVKDSNDPFIRCLFENMVQASSVMKDTQQPVFNHSFYFPVRLFSDKLLQRQYRTTALKYEMEAKKHILIQVWDDDEGISAEFLGSSKVNIRDVMSSKNIVKRTLRGPPPKDMKTEVNEFAKINRGNWYDTARDTHVFDGSRTELIGCTRPNTSTATIDFEVYFYPGEKIEHVVLSDKEDEEDMGSLFWRDQEKKFNRENLDLARQYALPFPESIGAKPPLDDNSGLHANFRRFLATMMDPNRRDTVIPLMSLLVRIITPEEYSMPTKLLHWMNCIPFESSMRQRRHKKIDHWKDPQVMLWSGKGPVQDHAVLLCSVLLGIKKEAYVCKGTILDPEWSGDAKQPKIVEHCWVMTREEGGWITFWEPCTREVYHLPGRWSAADPQASSSNGNKPGNDQVVSATAEEESTALENTHTHEVPDVHFTPEEVDLLPTIGRQPRAKQKARNKQQAGRELMTKKLREQRERLPQAPNPSMLVPDKSLVDWLPYDSIDIVFNMNNLWANHQNHHPACITYDFEPTKWCPLLKPDQMGKKMFQPINHEVRVGPVLKPEKLETLAAAVVSEVEENMYLFRQKQGLDTIFDRRSKLLDHLSKFLNIHEKIRGLDIDCCDFIDKPPEEWTSAQTMLLKGLDCGSCLKYDIEKEAWETKRYNKYGSTFTKSPQYQDYGAKQRSAWREILREIEEFEAERNKFPTKKGMVFKGWPMHFSTADIDTARVYLNNNSEYNKLVRLDHHRLFFTVYCKIFGMLGGVTSTWLYFGAHVPLEEDKPKKAT